MTIFSLCPYKLEGASELLGLIYKGISPIHEGLTLTIISPPKDMNFSMKIFFVGGHTDIQPVIARNE